MANIPPLRLYAADTDSPPLVVDARRLAAMLGVGIRTVRTWDAAGKLPAPDRETWEARRAAQKS